MKTVKEIKQTVNISDLIRNENIKYIQEWNSIKIQCLFHEDSTASMSCTDSKWLFHCFGCGMSWDILNILEQLYPSMSFPKRMKYLENIKTTNNWINRVIPRTNLNSPSIVKDKTYYKILDYICTYFQNSLTEEIINTYLLWKDLFKYSTYNWEVTMNWYGFKPESIATYRIGYSKNSKELYKKIKNKYSDQILNKYLVWDKLLWLFTKNGMSMFKNRIVFPVIVKWNVVSFIARQTEYSPVNKYSTWKYIIVAWDKSYLYNESDLDKSNIFIVEGITDCISLKEHWYNAIALIASSLKQNMIQSIVERLEWTRVYILLDTDKNWTWQKWAVNISKILTQYRIECFILELPLEKNKNKIDINTYFLNHNNSDFMKLIWTQIMG